MRVVKLSSVACSVAFASSSCTLFSFVAISSLLNVPASAPLGSSPTILSSPAADITSLAFAATSSLELLVTFSILSFVASGKSPFFATSKA